MKLVAGLLVLFCGPCPVLAEAQDAKNAESLGELLREVKGKLPKGWIASIGPSASAPWGLDRPSLVVESQKSVQISYQVSGTPDGKPEVREEKLHIRFEAVPYLSPPQFAEAKKRNERAKRLRLEFVVQRLQGVDGGFKREPPAPPGSYDPETPDENRAVVEYAFLWMRTMPEELPSHYHGSLAFVRNGGPHWRKRIMDKELSAEFSRVSALLDGIFKEYEKP